MGEGEPNPEGIKLLIDHSHTITPEMVIGQLEMEPYFQYQYIRALREREGGFLEDWGDLQVRIPYFDLISHFNYISLGDETDGRCNYTPNFNEMSYCSS